MSTPSARTGGSLDAWFKISQRGSTVRQEVVAGLTTFLAMVYSVIVVPGMLGKAGFPPAAVFVATCLVAGLGSIVMGLWANLPLAIGCAISLTAFTAFSLVLGQHISVPVALGAVFLMGVLFTVISATGIRSWILRNLPHGVAHGTGIGIGLFLLLIAANGVGLVIKNPLDGLPVALGDWSSGFRRMAQVEHRYGRYCRGAGDLLCGWLGYLILHRILKTGGNGCPFLFSPHIV